MIFKVCLGLLAFGQLGSGQPTQTAFEAAAAGFASATAAGDDPAVTADSAPGASSATASATSTSGGPAPAPPQAPPQPTLFSFQPQADDPPAAADAAADTDSIVDDELDADFGCPAERPSCVCGTCSADLPAGARVQCAFTGNSECGPGSGPIDEGCSRGLPSCVCGGCGPRLPPGVAISCSQGSPTTCVREPAPEVDRCCRPYAPVCTCGRCGGPAPAGTGGFNCPVGSPFTCCGSSSTRFPYGPWQGDGFSSFRSFQGTWGPFFNDRRFDNFRG